jgi:hypothetical protein
VGRSRFREKINHSDKLNDRDYQSNLEHNIKVDIKAVVCEDVDWIRVAQDRVQLVASGSFR